MHKYSKIIETILALNPHGVNLYRVENLNENMILLDENSFASNELYFIVYCNENEQSTYATNEKNNMEVLYSNADMMIVKPLNANLRPAKNDGMIAISNKTAKLAKATRDFPSVTEEDEKVREFMDQVSIENLTATVEYLQAYEERYYNSEKAYDAANWIQEQFDNLEVLETEQFPVSYYGNPCAPNIIAIQWGTKNPEEYVVCGSHLDSYSYSGMCPGADDNATGVASVLEAARILSQYSFERSIIYCAFGAEEVGLIGSAAYAEYCAESEKFREAVPGEQACAGNRAGQARKEPRTEALGKKPWRKRLQPLQARGCPTRQKSKADLAQH